jgi:hypothetical protein
MPMSGRRRDRPAYYADAMRQGLGSLRKGTMATRADAMAHEPWGI